MLLGIQKIYVNDIHFLESMDLGDPCLKSFFNNNLFLNLSHDIKFIKQCFGEIDNCFRYLVRMILIILQFSFFFFSFLVSSLRSFNEKYHRISLQAILNSIKSLQVSSTILPKTFTVISVFSNLKFYNEEEK